MAGYVLIVESDADLQRQIGSALREAGFELAAEAEAAWARRSWPSRSPDVVVLDTRLADGDGFRLPRASQSPETRAVPIVFVASTHRGVSHRAEARRRFAPAEYLPTPLDIAARGAAGGGARGARRGRRHRARRADDEQTPAAGGAEGQPARPGPAARAPRRRAQRQARWRPTPTARSCRGRLKRTPFARLLQRLYAKRATGSLLLLREATKKIVAFARRLSGVGAIERPRRDAGADPAGEAPHHQRGAGRIGRADAEGEAPPGGDPGRDGGAVALQPGARAGRTGRGEAVRDVLLDRRKVHVQDGRGRPRRRRPARALARGHDPRGHPPPLRRCAAEGRAGPVRAASTSPSAPIPCCACRR